MYGDDDDECAHSSAVQTRRNCADGPGGGVLMFDLS